MIYESKTSDGTIRNVISLCRRIKTPLEESTVNIFTWTEWVELVIHDLIAEVSQEGWKSIREATDDIMQKKKQVR